MPDPKPIKSKKMTEAITELSQTLRSKGVQALYLGDGNHYSTSVGLQMAGAVHAFKPDLYMIEMGVDSQGLLNKGLGLQQLRLVNSSIYNYLADYLVADFLKAKLVAVDDSEVSKRMILSHKGKPEYGRILQETRLSPQANQRIADRIVNEIAHFHKEHGRMPSIAVTFGAAHFASANDIDEMVAKGIKERGLPTLKSESILVRDSRKTDTSVALHRYWFGEYKYAVDVGRQLPPNIEDFRGPNVVPSRR
jgi:hypothetical protein